MAGQQYQDCLWLTPTPYVLASAFISSGAYVAAKVLYEDVLHVLRAAAERAREPAALRQVFAALLTVRSPRLLSPQHTRSIAAVLTGELRERDVMDAATLPKA